LDEWQALVVEHGLGEKADGRWAASEVALWVPRQNGKGGVIEAVVLAHLFLFGAKLVVWSAHEYRTAQQGFQRLKALVQDSPHLMKRVRRIYEGSGEQRIELKDGRRVQFNTRSRSALRGFTGDLLILDEAQELTEAQMAAILPTISARSMEVPGPQIWYFGTPPDNPAAWCYSLKDAGERGDDDLVWMDWGADLKPDATGIYAPEMLDDEDLLYACNPAMGVRISPQAAEKERKRLGQSYARERFGVWLPPVLAGETALSAEKWSAAYREPPLPPGSPLALSLDAWGDRWVISRAWRVEDAVAVEVAAEGLDVTQGVEALLDLIERHDPVAVNVDTYGPVAQVIPDLMKAGVRFNALQSGMVMDAWSRFVGEVTSSRVQHPGDELLNSAVAGAVTRKVGDRMALDRSKSSSAVPALMSAVLAAWGVYTNWDSDPVVFYT
jgi:phage terminase large subunit-like protein